MRLALNFQRVDPSKGGAETYVVDLCRRLIHTGHEVDLYAESWCEGFLPPEVKCIPVAAPGRTRLERMLAFGRNSEAALSTMEYDCTVGFINTWAHDVLIPQGGVHDGSLEAGAKRFPEGIKRVLYTLAKKANPRWWAYRAIEKKQFDADRSARFIAVSRMVMEHLQRFHHVPKHRVHVIPNAIDAERLIVKFPGAVRCGFRNKVGLAPNDLAGLFVGHNFRLKGLKPLLESLAIRKRDQPSARPIKLVVCGGGKLGPFRRMIKRLGLEQEVVLLGFFEDIRACYWSCDFFVSPTYYDPCSLVVFEALACGLPVITTGCNGAGELMTDGREGYVVTSPDSTADLISSLNRMTDDNARAGMSAHATVLGREQSMDRHVSRLIKVFEEVAAAKSRWGGPHLSKNTRGAGKLKTRVG